VTIGPAVAIEFEKDQPLAVGDKVVYAKYGGFAVFDGTDEFRVLNDEDIIARIS
jgi:co-chaperonin GroES (HSP10)